MCHVSHQTFALLYIDQVPAGVWSIYNTREICCGVHAPFSSTCETIGPNGPVSSSNDDLETDSAIIDRPQSAFETSSASSTSNTAIMSYTNGQPGWAIALMILIPLVLFCCIGYCIFVRDNDQEEKDVVVKRTNRSSDVRGRPRRHDDGKSLRCSRSRYDSFHSSLFTGRTSRARYPRRSRDERPRKDDNDGPSISLSNPQDPRFSADEFTVHTYTTMKKTAQDPQMTAIVLHEPNYEKPDPEGETTAGAIALALTNGDDKIRSVEPDMKPKLEPEESDTKPAPSQKAGPFVSSFVKVKAQKRVPGRRRTVDTSTSDNEDDNDNGSYGFRFSQPHIYAPTRKNKVSEELKGSFVTFATKGPNEEGLARVKKSIKKKKKKKKRDSSSSSNSSSNSRKRFEESRRLSSLTLLSFEERERAKEHRTYSGGVESSRSIGSIELELETI